MTKPISHTIFDWTFSILFLAAAAVLFIPLGLVGLYRRWRFPEQFQPAAAPEEPRLYGEYDVTGAAVIPADYRRPRP